MLTSNSPDRPSANSYWVFPGCFAEGEYPGAWDPVEAAIEIEDPCSTLASTNSST